MMHKLTLIFSFTLFVITSATAQNYVRKTNLPHLYIETFDHVSINSKETYVYATMHYVDEDDVVTQYDSMQIRGRGNSTWNLRKKPYRIKFNQKEKFLGKGYAKAKKWTLLANAADHSLMRNAITSLMGDFLGLKNNPAHKFVDVTLNGTFIGNYQISDQVDVRPHRVNITEQDLPLTDESDITGGYLLEVDGFRDGNCFTTSTYQVPIRIHYPDDEDITYSQNNYIRQYMKDFEAVLSGSNFADADNGYRAWVDSTSLVNWFIATEVSGNVDGYYSTYFYKDQQDSLLYWGPLWDYDIAYNNDNRTDRGGTNNTEYQLMTDNGYGATKNWINRMWQDPWFGRLVNRRYAEVLDAGLEDYLYQQIDSISDLLQESQELNFNKWGISTRMLRERVLFSSYDQYVADLKSYIGTHIPFLQTAFANKKAAEPTPPFVPGNHYYLITNISNSKAIDTVDKSGEAGDLICTWAVTDDQYSQQWQILPVANYFMLLNRNSGMALNDPTEGTSTATTNVGTQLNTAVADAHNERQLWSIVPQGTQGYYNLVNKYTNHTANQSGGGSLNGTAVLSYTTDSRNASSRNRLWYIITGDEIEEPDPDTPDDPDDPDNPDTPDNPDNPDPTPDAIASVEPSEYALGYNPHTKVLHFGSETPEQLTFPVRIYSTNGILMRTFQASEQCSVADFSHGIYIIMWKAGSQTRSTKLLIQ
ncbi:MAG: CotH kinase family protein [Bacteroidaceae bacterium]|nr:CotH kinase family protein [Bacteroidaceae bacterium]